MRFLINLYLALFAGDFHPAQPFPNEQKEGAAEGGHPGIDRADRSKTPPDQTADEVAEPESRPGQEDIKEQFVQTATFPEMEGGAVRAGKDNTEEDGGKSHGHLNLVNYIRVGRSVPRG